MINDTINQFFDILNLLFSLIPGLNIPITLTIFADSLSQYWENIIQFLTYVNYFIPLSRLVPIISLAFSMLWSRIIMAIVNLIWWG